MKTFFLLISAIIISITAGAQTPRLNSNPGASAVIFLDFDGQLVTGTSWNWSGAINAQSAGLSSDTITEIFNRVAEDYRIFNLNITTDSSVYEAAPGTKRSRIIITTTYQWYGAAGGVAFVGSFTWGDETPAWVFSGLLGNKIKNIAEAISHEAGHTLGLQHQSNYDINCVKTAEYNPGRGSGEISWAPIMGVGYYRNSTTWHNGPNAFGCSYIQSDIDVISGSPNDIGLRTDDYGDTHLQSTAITVVANVFKANGIINTAEDKDVFSIKITNPTTIKVNAIPQNVGNNNAGANIDIRISLLNAAGDTLNRYNPTELLNAGIDTNLNSADYYLVVEGVSNSNLPDYGSRGFYSLTGTLAAALPVWQLVLSGTTANGSHLLKWNYQSDERIGTIFLESSADGTHFGTLAQLGTGSASFSCKSYSGNTTWYRIKVVLEEGKKSYYSNIVALRAATRNTVFVENNIVNNEIVVSSNQAYQFQLLDERGKLLQQGPVVQGKNRLPVYNLQNGLLFLRVFNQSGSYLFKIVKQ